MTQGTLAGRTALVTGATRGIGLAIALRLAGDGATVIGTATTDEGAAKIAALLADAGNAGTGMKLDVTDATACDTVIGAIEAKVGPVGILVNNAGITRDSIASRAASGRSFVMSVAMKPGATQLTVMPRLPSSRASDRVMPATPAFATA